MNSDDGGAELQTMPRRGVGSETLLKTGALGRLRMVISISKWRGRPQHVVKKSRGENRERGLV
jgi:hypothetical protein